MKRNILTNLGILAGFLAFIIYVKQSTDDADFFLFLLIIPIFHFLFDMRRKIIVEKGYIRYVRLIGVKEVLLKDVYIIQWVSGMSGGRSESKIEVRDHEGNTYFTIPDEVLYEDDFVRFEKAVWVFNPKVKIDLSGYRPTLFWLRNLFKK